MKERLTPEEERLEQFFLSGPLELAEKSGFTKNRIEILLNSMLIKSHYKEEELREKIFQKLRKIQKWRNNRREEKYLLKLLRELSLNRLKILFRTLFLEEKLIIEADRALRSLRKALEILFGQGIDSLRNLYLKSEFIRMITKKEFQREDAVFPKIALRARARKKILIGKYRKIPLEAWIPAIGFPAGKVLKVKISPQQFVKFYGWLFLLEIEEKKKLCFVKETKKGLYLNLFQREELLKDFIKKENTQSLPMLPFQENLGRAVIFYLLTYQRKRLEISLKNCCQKGDWVEMIPAPGAGSLNLEFYKIIGDEKKFLRRYVLQREPLHLERLD